MQLNLPSQLRSVVGGAAGTATMTAAYNLERKVRVAGIMQTAVGTHVAYVAGLAAVYDEIAKRH
jgi:hypothetical protein